MVELIDNVTGIFGLENETIIIYAYAQKKTIVWNYIYTIPWKRNKLV